MARVRIEPRCARGENVFISSEGYLLPCCYAHILLRRMIAAPDEAREADLWFYQHRESFDLTKRCFAEVAADPLWDELRCMWAEDRAPEICYRYCGVPEESSVANLDDVRRGDRIALHLKPDRADVYPGRRSSHLRLPRDSG